MDACRDGPKRPGGAASVVVLDGELEEGTAELLESVDIAICSSDFKPLSAH